MEDGQAAYNREDYAAALRLWRPLAEQGVAIIMISSELPEILGMSDRIAVMHAGSVAGILARQEATQSRIMALALGTESPQ